MRQTILCELLQACNQTDVDRPFTYRFPCAVLTCVPLQKPLVGFKAGLVNTERVPGDATRLRMVADPRKGEIRLTRNMDGTMELMWRDRSTGTAVHRFMVFPGDVGFKRIRTGRDADRVWELRFLAAGDARRFFFWMQSGKPEKDEENASKLLRMINDPAAAAAEAAGGAGAAAGGRAGGRAGRAGGAAAAGGGGALSRDELQAMLAAMVSPRHALSALLMRRQTLRRRTTLSIGRFLPHLLPLCTCCASSTSPVQGAVVPTAGTGPGSSSAAAPAAGSAAPAAGSAAGSAAPAAGSAAGSAAPAAPAMPEDG